MSIPLLSYEPTSQNHRVVGYEVPGDEQPRLVTPETFPSPSEMDEVITAAYRQIFHEQQMLETYRLPILESQLRARQITIRDFIHGLLVSDSFRRLNYDANNNYRFVELCIQRTLGRHVYGDREKLAWSIVIATKGLHGFITDLLNSDEYLNAFGENIVPYQRRRILPQHERGDLPFQRMARYGTHYRDSLPQPNINALFTQRGVDGLFTQFEPFDLDTFFKRANWPMVSAVMVILLMGVAAAVAIAAANTTPIT